MTASIIKSFGFGNSSPYTSFTFNRNNEFMFGRNGLLKAKSITNDGANVKIVDITFIQQGLMVQRIGTVLETFPVDLPAPFYLAASVPDILPTDNIAWSFVRRPQDIGANTVLLAEWDGQEWRNLERLSTEGIIEHRLEAAKAYDNLGFNQGFRFSPSPSFDEYLVAPGQLTDKTGHLTTKEEETLFDEISADPDYDRIDSIIYRRLSDDKNRIGQLILRPGNTFSGPTITSDYATTIGSPTDVRQKPRIINFDDNTVGIFYIKNYGNNGELYYTKYSSNRQTVLIAPKQIATKVVSYDADLDKNGDIMIAFVRAGRLYRAKVDDDGEPMIAPAAIDTLDNPISKPVLRSDALGFSHIMFIYQIAPSVFAPYYMRINVGGSISTAASRLINSSHSYSKVDFQVNDDLELFTVYTNSTLDSAEYQRLDEVGEEITQRITVSDETDNDGSIIFSPIRNAKIQVSETNAVYITFEQQKTLSLYGFCIYNSNYKELFGAKAIMTEFESSVENIVDHQLIIDWNEHGHILADNGSKLFYYKRFLPNLSIRFNTVFDVDNATTAGFDMIYDKQGALFQVFTQAPSGTTNNGLPISGLFFGAGTYGDEAVFISNTEFAVPINSLDALSPVPTIGDTFTIGSSTASNNGTYIIESERLVTIDDVGYRVFQTENASVFSAESGTPAEAQFTEINANTMKSVKQSSAIGYDFSVVKSEELETDLLAVLIKKSDNSYLAWYEGAFIPAGDLDIRGEYFLTSAGLIDFNKDTSGGEITWAEPLYVRDPYRNNVEIAAQTVSDFGEGDVLYIRYPKAQTLISDGDTSGPNIATVVDTSQFFVGQKVFVGDFDSTGLYTTVSAVGTGEITVAVTLSEYTISRGAFIIPTEAAILKEPQNSGPLKPNSVGLISSDIYVIALRSNDLVHFRDGGLTLEHEESGSIGDGVGEPTLSFIGAPSQATSKPTYSSVYFLTQNTSLQVGLGAMDTALKVLADRFNQDRNLKLVSGGTFSLTLDMYSVAELAWSADAYVHVPGVNPNRNTISAGSKTLINDGDCLYVLINRSGAGPTILTVNKAHISSLDPENNKLVILARKDGNDVLVGTHSFRLKDGEFLEIDGALAEINRYFSQLRLVPHPTNPKRVVITGADTSKLSGSQLGQTLDNLFLGFLGAEVDLETGGIFETGGAIPLGSLTFTPPTVPSGEYAWHSFTIVPFGLAANGQLAGQVLVLTGETFDTDVDIANQPPLGEGIPLGRVFIKSTGSGIEDVTYDNIVQLGVGSGSGSGGGNANELRGRVQNRLNLTKFKYAAVNVFAESAESLIDAISTAKYSIVGKNYEFENIGDILLTKNMLGVDFLNSRATLSYAELSHYVDLSDDFTGDNATYEISRDGGNNWSLMSLTRIGASDTYRGSYSFEDEPSDSFGQNLGGALLGGPVFLDASNEIITSFTLARKTTIRELVSENTFATATVPSGFIYFEFRKDSGGSPDLTPEGFMGRSQFFDVSLLGAPGAPEGSKFAVELTLPAGDYHVILKSDVLYKAQYLTTRRIEFQAGDGDVGDNIFGALNGYENDLRVRITRGSDELVSEGVGILYHDQGAIFDDGTLKRKEFTFDGISDNLSTFDIGWYGDPRLLMCFEIGKAKVYRYGLKGFLIDGTNVIFEPNTFNVAGSVTLEFIQFMGATIVNDETITAIIIANHLGSTDSNLDFSKNGRGIFLRRPDGTLRELTINNADEIDIYSV